MVVHEVEEEESEEEEEEQSTLHTFFDVEAMQEKVDHEPNLLVAETEESEEPVVFAGEHCIKNFLEWLVELSENDERNVTVITHNFQGYDGYFIVHEYYGNNQLIEQLRNGCKLLEVKHDRIRFIDSLSFFQMPLSAFPKTEFEQWHDNQRSRNVVFNFAEELIAYCLSDVKLLKEGCLQFKELFEEKSGFNPFDKITLASACNQGLRQNRMIPNSIASEPLHGWENSINQSTAAKEWLHWQDHQLRQTALDEMTPEDMEVHDLMALAYPDYPHPSYRHYIQHAGNAGEFKIPETRFTVDGYAADTNTIYEFHGCFWHGCEKCFPVRHEKHARLLDRTMYDMFEKNKTTHPEDQRQRLPCRGDLGVPMARNEERRPPNSSLCEAFGIRGTTEPTRFVLWRQNECDQTLSSHHCIPAIAIHRLHKFVSLH